MTLISAQPGWAAYAEGGDIPIIGWVVDREVRPVTIFGVASCEVILRDPEGRYHIDGSVFHTIEGARERKEDMCREVVLFTPKGMVVNPGGLL